MEMVLLGLGGILALVSLICQIFIYVHAFKSSVGEGFMCLCVPCYILYYGFSKFEHPQKALILGGWLGAGTIGNVMIRFAVPDPGYGGGYNGY